MDFKLYVLGLHLGKSKVGEVGYVSNIWEALSAKSHEALICCCSIVQLGLPALLPICLWPGLKGDETGTVTSNSDKGDLKHADLIIAREAEKDATVGQRLKGWARGSREVALCGMWVSSGRGVLVLEHEGCDF